MPQLAVEVRNLVMRYGDTTAVDELDLSVAAASITAVLGPNGAGKTTTLETCEGYRRPQSGSVRVLGLDPWLDRQALLPRIGVMLQRGGAWSGARAEEVLRHLAKMYAHPLEIDLLVERLGLAGCLRTPYRRLSGGEQQRLSLAMALIGRPQLVFMDEPTAGLDPHARRSAWELLDEVRTDGVTVVLTTHFMEEAERLADQVVVIDHGQVLASGTPGELTRAHDQTSVAFFARPGLDVESLRAAMPGVTVVTESSPGRYDVSGGFGPQGMADLLAWCSAHEVVPEGLSMGRRTLEDVFLELTERGPDL